MIEQNVKRNPPRAKSHEEIINQNFINIHDQNNLKSIITMQISLYIGNNKILT